MGVKPREGSGPEDETGGRCIYGDFLSFQPSQGLSLLQKFEFKLKILSQDEF